MGRYIYEGGDYVWKYCFAVQPSEQHRISTEFGIGNIEEGNGGDTLYLTYDDVPKLEELVKNAKGYPEAKKIHDDFWEGRDSASFDDCKVNDTEAMSHNPDVYFYMMVEAYIKHMKDKHEEFGDTEFYFEGEY